MEESLEDWYARRQQRRRSPGTLRILPLAPGAQAAHLHPEAPRLVLEWDGYGWVPAAVADDYAAAGALLRPPTGRHRKV
ncbi:DUF6087 family protein [Kitasatospora sp. NPDC052896]|uniref:DUF6087 family protein n=1 Tax=Kitasatospora sp. NPDC052896 TaxID=3364061 RepID=UPI0037CA92D2